MADNFNDLYVFTQIAQLKSFSQTAKLMGLQPSALSHRMTNLENQLSLKLLHRTTRSVSTTQAGQQLLDRIAPLFEEISQQVVQLSDFSQQIGGKIRINSPERPVYEIVYPKMKDFLLNYPEVELDVFINNSYIDIIAERFDFGIRSGQDIANDMVAVRISEPNTMAVVATPSYLAQYGEPKTPYELVNCRCIVPSFSPTYCQSQWEFMQDSQIEKIRIPENIVFNTPRLVRDAVMDGLGVTWLPSSTVKDGLLSGQLVELFAKKAITYPPMYLYYAKNQHKTVTMMAVIDWLRVDGK